MEVHVTKSKILFTWKLDLKLQNFFEAKLGDFENIDLIFPDSNDKNEYMQFVPESQIIVGWRPDTEILEKAVNLKIWINPGAGVQRIVPLFRKFNAEKRIILINGHGNSYFTAQHGAAMLLSFMNRIIPHHKWMKEGKWRTGDNEMKSIPLRDRKIGFLGYGAVNSKIHRFLAGFRCSFAALKRDWSKIKKSDEIPFGLIKFTLDEFEDFLRFADILFAAVPETDKTRNMIGEKELSLLGKNCILVNISRGPVINEKDLYYSLKNRKIAGAALDVWYDYSPEPDENGYKYPYTYPFHELENVLLSPHRAASPFDDLEKWEDCIENIFRFAVGREDFLNIVDLKAGY